MNVREKLKDVKDVLQGLTHSLRWGVGWQAFSYALSSAFLKKISLGFFVSAFHGGKIIGL